MTATERFYEGSKDDIISMDDEDIYGDTFALMSFKEAIELQLLTDYKVITIDIQKSEIADFIRDNNLVQLNDKWKKETEARSLASMLALRKAMKRFNIKNAVSFHSSIEKARRNKDLQQHITDTYDYQPIDTYTVSGKDATTKRNDIVQEFAKSDKALITNARCLTEGVDVPNIDCIVFADPRKSRVDIVQALGRALRKKEGKEWGYVILPVIYDNTTNEIDNDNFNEILDVVRGLAANDERIVEYFKDKGEINTKAKKETEEQFNFEVLSEYMDEGELSKQLQIKVWEKLSKFHWMEFEKARLFIHKIGLKNQKEWNIYCKSGKKPKNIPQSPKSVYKDSGWISLGDWLGNGNIATKHKNFRPYNQAVKYLIHLELKSESEYRKIKDLLPTDIPRSPYNAYKHRGWVSWGHYLSTGNIAPQDRKFMTYNEAVKFNKKNGIESQSIYKKYRLANNVKRLPSNPNSTYKNNGWTTWGEFLGTKAIAPFNKKFISYQKAKEYAISKGFNTSKDWQEHIKRGEKPDNIPASPGHNYPNEWEGWELFFGKEKIRNIDYLLFKKARTFVRKLNLKTQSDWKKYCNSGNKPHNIPANPSRTYRSKGWTNLGDWLGTNSVANQNIIFISYNEAKAFVHKLKLPNQKAWNDYRKSEGKPSNIPSCPNRTYKGDWEGWGEFLGNGNISPHRKSFLDYKDAKLIVSKLNIKSGREWRVFSSSGQRPSNIPSQPEVKYKNKGWKGWKDFLGNE